MDKYPEIWFSPSLVAQVGSISRVLGQFLDRQTEEVQASLKKEYPDAPGEAIRKLLGSFATLEGTKKPLPPDEIQLPGLSPEAIRFCLVELENARILRFDDYAYELSHDTLAQRIAEQRSAAEVALLEATKLVKDRLEAYAATGTYLNNKELQLIDNYTEGLKEFGKLSDKEWAYIEKSSRELQKRRRRRVALVTTVIVLLALLAAFGITQWLIARQQKAIAEEKRLEAEAQEELAMQAALKADSARIVADSAFLVARSQEQKAIAAREEAEANAREARQNLQLAIKNEEEARRQRDKAEDYAQKVVEEKARVEAREAQLRDRNQRISALNDSINEALLEIAQQQAIAQGNFLKSEALLTLQTGDPTKAFRIAEYAWKKEPGQPAIYPPFLNIYYSGRTFYYLNSFCTAPFYQIYYQSNQSVEKAILSPDQEQSLILFREVDYALLRRQSGDIRLEHPAPVRTLCFSRTGNRLASGDKKGNIHIWDAQGRITQKLKGHSGAISDMAFLDEDRYLVSTGADQQILLWDLEESSPEPVRLKLPRMRRDFRKIAVSPDGSHIAAITDKSLFFFSRKTRNLYTARKVKLLKVEQAFQDIQFTPDGEELYLFTRQAIRYIDIDKGRERDIFTFSGDIASAELDPTGNYLLLTFVRNRTAELFDLQKKESIARLQGHSGWIRSAVFSSDGSLALSSSEDNTVRLWKLNGKTIPHYVGRQNIPFQQSVNPYEYSYRNDSIQIVKKWEDRPDWTFKRKLAPDSKVVLSKEGSRVVILSQNSKIASLWLRDGGSTLLTGHSGNLTAAAFPAEGDLLATASDKGEVIFWDAAGNRLHQLSPGNQVRDIWFSSDGKHLVVEFPDEQFVAYRVSAEGLQEKTAELKIPELDRTTKERLNLKTK